MYDVQSNDEPTGEAGFVGTTLSTADDDSTNSTVDFGFFTPMSVGSLVWLDLNGNGLQEASEPPLAGTQLSLLAESGGVFSPAVDIEGNPVAAITVGADGLYLFDNLLPGDYKIQVTPPAAYFASPVQTLLDDDEETDSNIASQPTAGVYESVVFSLEADLEPQETDVQRGDVQDATQIGSATDLNGNMTIDFGFVEPASIGNYVWLDLDMDGVQDANEEGIANVVVNLYEDSDGNGVIEGAELTTPVATAVTGSNGEYLFPDLMPGVVYITQVDETSLPANMTQTFDEGTVLDHTSDPIVLTPGEEHLTADFGYTPPLGSIGDTIWVDSNDNGQQDPGEPGLAGVTVTLTPPPDVDPDGSGPAGPGDPITVVTDENGKYLFPDLPLNESYIVTVTSGVPAEYMFSSSGNGDPDVRDGNSDPSQADESTIVVLTDQTPVNLDADFGYLPDDTVNNSIGDTVWLDIDGDGNGPIGAGDGSDVDEPGIAGVTVTLIEDNGDGIFNPADDAVIGTQTTDANGQYLFTGLPDGDYLVLVTDQNNVLSGLAQTVDADDPANPGSFVAVTPDISFVDDLGVGVATPVSDLDQDFGYSDPNNTGNEGSIGDTVFFDSDNSGDPSNSDPNINEGIEGVTVELYSAGPDGIIGNADDVLIGSTLTDENGMYLFTGLDVSDTGANPGSDYRVEVVTSTLPNGSTGWVNSVDPDTANPGDSQSVVTLSTANPQDLDQDFGYVSTDNNSISGTVWPDTDGSGVQEENGFICWSHGRIT